MYLQCLMVHYFNKFKTAVNHWSVKTAWRYFIAENHINSLRTEHKHTLIHTELPALYLSIQSSSISPNVSVSSSWIKCNLHSRLALITYTKTAERRVSDWVNEVSFVIKSKHGHGSSVIYESSGTVFTKPAGVKSAVMLHSCCCLFCNFRKTNGWMNGWTEWTNKRTNEQLTEWTNNQQNKQTNKRPTDRPTKILNDRTNERTNDWLTDRMIDRINQWTTDRTNERTTDQTTDWPTEQTTDGRTTELTNDPPTNWQNEPT